MPIDDESVYPSEAAHAATEAQDDDLDAPRGIVNSLLYSLLMWALLLVAIASAIALILPAGPAK